MKPQNNPFSKEYRSFYERVHSPVGKVAVVVAAIALMVAWYVGTGKAFGSSPKEEDYAWSVSKSAPLAPRYVTSDRTGVKTYAKPVCKSGYYPVFSKYTGMRCESRATDQAAAKWLTRCSGYVIIGYVFGKLDGAKASIAGCIWSLY